MEKVKYNCSNKKIYSTLFLSVTLGLILTALSSLILVFGIPYYAVYWLFVKGHYIASIIILSLCIAWLVCWAYTIFGSRWFYDINIHFWNLKKQQSLEKIKNKSLDCIDCEFFSEERTYYGCERTDRYTNHVSYGMYSGCGNEYSVLHRRDILSMKDCPLHKW